MKTDIGRTIYTCYLITGGKIGGVKSAGTSKNHARELTLSDIHRNLVFRAEMPEAARSDRGTRGGAEGEGGKERTLYVVCCTVGKNLSHNELFLPPSKSHVRQAFIGLVTTRPWISWLHLGIDERECLGVSRYKVDENAPSLIGKENPSAFLSLQPSARPSSTGERERLNFIFLSPKACTNFLQMS